ncbi:MAG: phosphotransferase family protein [Candidatus Rokuibacteriota bacterium]
MTARLSPELRDRLLERVRERAGDYFPGLGDAAVVRIITERHRPYSEIFRVVVEDGRTSAHELVIKVARRADLQYRALTAVWPGFAGHPTLTVPRPLDYLAEGPALVMEAVRGEPLLARLPIVLWHRRAVARAENDCRRAGQWLRFYHQQAESAGVGFNASAKWRLLLQAFAELEAAGIDRGLLRHVVERLQSLLDGMDLQSRPVARLHGEFTVDNVLVDGEHVAGIDVWGGMVNTVDHDIASYLNSLLLLPLTRPVSARVVERLRLAFLRGYHGRDLPDEPATTLLQAIGLADVGLEILTRRRAWLVRAWVRRSVSAALGTLVNRRTALRAPITAAVNGQQAPLPGCSGQPR